MRVVLWLGQEKIVSLPNPTRVEAYVDDHERWNIILLNAEDSFDIVVENSAGERETVWSVPKREEGVEELDDELHAGPSWDFVRGLLINIQDSIGKALEDLTNFEEGGHDE